MRLGSLFAGVGGFDLGFEREGFETVWQVEREAFCQAVLKTRFPKAELHSDVRDVGKHNLGAVDVITFGFPCQDLSVAGKRAGLGGSRSGLFWEAQRIVGELRPRWFVAENVPGLFSSEGGRDFAVVLSAMVELGYGVGWRVCDSRYWGVAQRRRRVFLVGHLGDPLPESFLPFFEGGEGDFEAGGEAAERASGEVAASLGGAGRSGGFAPNAEQSAGGYLQLWDASETANTLRAQDGHGSGNSLGYGNDNILCGAITSRDWKGADNIYAEEGKLVASALSSSNGHHGHSIPRGDGSDNLVCGALDSSRGGADDNAAQANHVIAIGCVKEGRHQSNQNGRGWSDEGHSYTLSGTDEHGVAYDGPPTDPYRVREATSPPAGLDSARYRALGNAVTVSVAQWIAQRIAEASQ